MPAIRGALCCWATLELGREEMNGSVSVFGSFEPRQCVYTRLHVCRCMHGSMCNGCTFFTICPHALLFSSALNSSPQSVTTGTSKCVPFPPEVNCLCGFQVPSILPADISWGRQGVVEIPFNRGASGHWQPVPAVSTWSFLHHHWKIPLLQPA